MTQTNSINNGKMNYSRLVGHSVKSSGSIYSREKDAETTYNEKMNRLSNILLFKISPVTKLLLVADLADQINYYTPYIEDFRRKIYEACGASFVEATYQALPSVNLKKFLSTLRSHFVGLKGSDKELCLELMSKYMRKFPNLDEFFGDVLTKKDYDLIEKNY